MSHSLFEQSFILLLLRSVALSFGWLMVALAARRLSAACLGTWWRAGFVGLLGLSAVSLAPAAWHLPVIPRFAETDATNGRIGLLLQSVRSGPAMAAAPMESALSHRTVHLGNAHTSTHAYLIWLWSAGVVVLLVRAATSAGRVHRLVRGASPMASSEWSSDGAREAAYFGLSRPVLLLLSPAVPAPFAAGIFRAVIVVPETACRWSVEQRRAVLRHEFAHIARRDLLFQWLAELVVALQWPNPFVWIARRRLALAQERAADDAVVAGGVSRLDYATFLTDSAQQGRRLARELMLAPMARQSTLGLRIARLLDPRQRRTPTSPTGRFLVATFALSIALVLGLTGLRAQDDAAAKSKEPIAPGVKATPTDPSWTRTYRDTYRLNPSFAERFRGNSEEALVAFRKELEAAGIALPAEEVKLELAPDKSVLTTEFGGAFLTVIQQKLKPFLREHGWWRVPLEAEEELIRRELKPLADHVEKYRKRTEEAGAELSRIAVANKIVDPDPESFNALPTTAERNAVDLEKQLNEQSLLVTKLKRQLEEIMKLQPEQLKDVMRILQIEDPMIEKAVTSLNEARVNETRLSSAGLGNSHPKVRALRAEMEVFSRQLADTLAAVQSNWAVKLQIEQATLADLKAKLSEVRATPNSISDKTRLGPYIEAKARYLMAKKIFEAAQTKYSSELFQRGSE